MAEIAWTLEAQRWLEDIFEYIAADNPQAAARTVQGICDCSADFPMAEGFGGDIELTRTQTIMQRASHCDFRYKRMKPKDGPDAA